MRSEGNDPKIGEPTVGFSFTEMLQHTSRFRLKDFLAKYNVVTLEYPPYSPDLAPSDFYLFPQTKSALKGRHFCDATYVVKNATW
jgi:transposase